MFSIILMIIFSGCVASYGYIGLFKQEWLMNLRSMSAKVEGKDGFKHDELSPNITQARKIMAIAALVLGILGILVSVATLFVFFQAQAGPISV